jgi:hypothetical protein
MSVDYLLGTREVINVNGPIYKYIKRRKYANDFFEDGLIRIGTLYDFRQEEKHGTEIGDKDEGTKTLTTDGYHFIDTASPSTIPSWFSTNFSESFNLRDGARLQIHARDGVRLRLTVPDRYVFCASREFDGALISKCEYECCIRINNPLGFFGALSRKLKHKATLLGVGVCTYRPRLILGHEDSGFEPSLIKEERYKYQNEVRAVWSANQSDITPVIIKAKKARHFCEIQDA